jgi:hypothetical protein
MKEATRRFLETLEEAPLLARLGSTAPDARPRTQLARSWDEADEILRDDDLQRFRVERANEMRRQLPQARLNCWNDLVRVIGDDVSLLVEPSAARLGLPEDGRTRGVNAARWDLVHACLEHEYGDVVMTRFYRDLAEWYARGHLVCGWRGGTRSGTLFVF